MKKIRGPIKFNDRNRRATLLYFYGLISLRMHLYMPKEHSPLVLSTLNCKEKNELTQYGDIFNG